MPVSVTFTDGKRRVRFLDSGKSRVQKAVQELYDLEKASGDDDVRNVAHLLLAIVTKYSNPVILENESDQVRFEPKAEPTKLPQADVNDSADEPIDEYEDVEFEPAPERKRVPKKPTKAAVTAPPIEDDEPDEDF